MNKNFFAGLFLGLGLLLIVAFRPVAQKPDAGIQKWEYLKTASTPAAMNEAGQKGWELTNADGGTAYFKRPVQE